MTEISGPWGITPLPFRIDTMELEVVRPMLISKPARIPYSEVTPKEVYWNRRRFLAAGGAVAAAMSSFSAQAAKISNTIKTSHNAGGEKVTPREITTGYNNFYEFGTGKEQPAELSKRWTPAPDWKVEIGGEVMKPKTLSLDAIMKLAPLEERIYRHRCVEMWSIVVPWVGFPLSVLLKQVEPTSKAKFVAFESYYDSKVMWSPREAGIDFPYVEGLRLDEAMHPLALVGVGVYGETLPNQNGAPIRLVVPWKYGFKSIKSITKIRFVEKQPPTTWNIAWGAAYGFYSNVNPNRAHPRNGPQSSERRLGEGFLGQGVRRDTMMFNGYNEVASLYTGMDLIKNY
jgi:sulfoxide reductase catalytic subunit YedY